jgi:uncharacterized lipoprotein YddW (UPF0748 family)
MIKRVILIGIGIAILLSVVFQIVNAEPVEEARGIWIVRHSMISKKSIAQALYKAKQHNFNMVFVQVVGRGDAFYESSILPQIYSFYDSDGNGFDPLEYAVELGHRLGLEVHAWVNVYYVWSSYKPPRSSNHVYYTHPEWMMVDNYGRSIMDYTFEEKKQAGVEGNYLSPGNPSVRHFLRSVVKEIVDKYDVDGIHLDYVRYPAPQFSFDPVSRARFEKEYRVDPLALINRRGNWSAERYRELFSTWKNWRAEQVSKLVRGIFYDLEGRNRELQLSAAVIANLNYARSKFGQQWDEWMKEGIIDFVVPMAYSTDTNQVIRYLATANANKYDRYIYAGLGVYNQSAESAIEKYYRARHMGLKGVVLFSYDGIKDDPQYFDALKSGPLKYTAIPPEMPWKKEEPKQVQELFPYKIGVPKWTLEY